MKNNKRYALVSVYDKRNLLDICKIFHKFNIEIISTGGTAKKIKEIGFDCLSVSNLTKFEEILDGKVKTLHPKIHGSILHDRKDKNDIRTFNKLNFPKIDFVLINLYPFKQIASKTKNLKNCIKMIDIGGPAMLRSAAKNFNFVTSISDTDYYDEFINNLIRNKGFTSLSFRKKMAQIVFQKTAKYDQEIFNWFMGKTETISFDHALKVSLKYGENPNQDAFFYKTNSHSIFDSQFHGKQIGYNNILDLNSGLDCLEEFKEPTCVIIKHSNPCGVASKKNITEAFTKAFESDHISAFGGIVLLNRKITKKLSHKLKDCFFEIVAAPEFSNDAKKILKKKENLILINTKRLSVDKKDEIKSVAGGYVIQKKNEINLTKKTLNKVSVLHSKTKKIDDLIFAMKVCKHVKSNAIVLVNNKQTLGIGAGQMSRIDSTKIAILKMKKNKKNKNFVAASDAFFPFIDNIKKLKSNGCDAIVQPSGSKKDGLIIQYANKIKISLYFINNRFFKH